MVDLRVLDYKRLRRRGGDLGLRGPKLGESLMYLLEVIPADGCFLSKCLISMTVLWSRLKPPTTVSCKYGKQAWSLLWSHLGKRILGLLLIF